MKANELLRVAGIGPALPPEVRAESARLLRRLRERLVQSIGLLPADDDVAVPSVALELGRALADKSAGAVAVVDARGTWPCAAALIESAKLDGTPRATQWLDEGLAVLIPRSRKPGIMLAHLHDVVSDLGGAFHHLVVDLTGFDRLGEQQAAFELLDGVAIVARSGRTTARQIRRALADLPEGRNLGVLLTGS